MGKMPENCNDAAKIEYLISQGHSEHCAQRQVWGDGECECPDVAAGYNPDAWKEAKPALAPLTAKCKTCGADCDFDHTPCPACGASADVAPAPLPGEVDVALSYIHGVTHRGVSRQGIVRRYLTSQARRIAELKSNAKSAWEEAHALCSRVATTAQERDRWRNCAVYLDYRGADYCVAIHKELDGLQEDNRVHRSQVSKLLAEWKSRAEAAEERIAELEADAEVWSASVSDLARKVVAAKARAEAAEAQLALANQEIEQHAERILNLLLDERKVREWARGRCETCGYMLMDLPDRYGAACGECENGTNWTPAWEVK